MKQNNLEHLVKSALSSTDAPDPSFNNQLKRRMEDQFNMKNKRKPRFALVAAAALLLFTSVTALAMYRLMTPGEVAAILGDQALAEAFESGDSLLINQQRESGGYVVTLLGIVSLEGQSQNMLNTNFEKEKSYAVVAIERADGEPMPSTMDADYDAVNFFISPLIKGQIPWNVNIFSMGGASSTSVVDGTMYRIIECDSFEIFADRGVYLCVQSGHMVYDIEAFDYNRESGEITPRPDYSGVNLLFDLPLDQAKADRERAEQYLQEILGSRDDPEDGDFLQGESEEFDGEVYEIYLEEEDWAGILIED